MVKLKRFSLFYRIFLFCYGRKIQQVFTSFDVILTVHRR